VVEPVFPSVFFMFRPLPPLRFSTGLVRVAGLFLAGTTAASAAVPGFSTRDFLNRLFLGDLDETRITFVAGFTAIALAIILLRFRKEVKDLVDLKLTVVHRTESKMLAVSTAIAEEIKLQPLLHKVMDICTDILDADRSTLFLHDSATAELWSNVAQGIGTHQIRFPDDAGIAGEVFSTGNSINIRQAYKDDRFNKAIDKKTGYRTRSILCVQVKSKNGTPIGVMQVLNKKGGPFESIDERRLKAFCAQAAIAIENAQLFEEVLTIKNYNEAIVESMRSGVITLNADGRITKINQSAERFLERPEDMKDLAGRKIEEVFTDGNKWVVDEVSAVLLGGSLRESLDVPVYLPMGDLEGVEPDKEAQANLSILPLSNAKDERIGCLILIEDISNEKRLRSTMSRYMTKEIADKLMEEGEDALGGTEQQASILFSDIKGFTAFSERTGATETVAMLNGYFTVMVDMVMNHGGILDKYMGDGMMAVFGAPFPGEQDADNAIQAALGMFRALEQFNEERKGAGKETIDIRVGLNTDQVVSGNIGSARRMDYTVIGDGVNLAARLEGASKAYGTRLLISEFTVKALHHEYSLRQVDRLRVQGKKNPVDIYEALDSYPKGVIRDVPALMQAFEEALIAYKNQEWELALQGFQASLAVHPTDRVSQVYRSRCEIFAANPPPEDWDGVWVMTHK
jgi:adenylate cyclase